MAYHLPSCQIFPHSVSKIRVIGAENCLTCFCPGSHITEHAGSPEHDDYLRQIVILVTGSQLINTQLSAAYYAMGGRHWVAGNSYQSVRHKQL